MNFGKLELIKPNGATLNISDPPRYVVNDYDGFGAPPGARITEQGPLQHGETDRGFRLQAREMQIGLALRARSWDEMYERREELLDYLSPVNALTLRFTRPNGVVRQIGCYCNVGPTYGKRDASGGYQKQIAAFQLRAPDPAWYDPVQRVVQVVSGPSGGSGFMFPGPVPWFYGGSVVNAERALAYTGNWLEYPVIIINGPVSDPKITHLETGETLDFDGTVLVEGDQYTIDLSYDRKTVVNAVGVRRLDRLTPESDLATWALQPGSNTIRFEGTSAGASTWIAIRFFNRYLGV